MKNKLISAALVLTTAIAASNSTANARGPAIETDYQAQLIAGETYVIHGPLETPSPANQGFTNNPAIVLTDEGLVIIDAGGSVQSGEMVLKKAKQISDLPVVASISTHIHGDHWLGNHAIKEAYPDSKFYAHPAMIKQAKEGEAETWVNLILELTKGASAGTVPVIPDQIINDGDVLKIGGKTFQITHTGHAHTLTDVMVHVLEDDVYFLGDNTFNGRMGRIDDGSYVGLDAALNQALSAKAAHYVPGHGVTGDHSVVESYQTMMSTIYQSAVKYYDEGMSDFEMKPLIVEALKPWHSWNEFDQAIGRFISLAVLEAESHAFD